MTPRFENGCELPKEYPIKSIISIALFKNKAGGGFPF
jgi:hypothetical protein